MLLDRLLKFSLVQLAIYHLSTSGVLGRVLGEPGLLDANRVPLTALTSPGNFYFLEFPVDETDPKSPICADGSPYSFAFRRGSDEHMSKFLIEFEGGPACWSGGDGPLSCTNHEKSTMRRRTPWNGYLEYFATQVFFDKIFPDLGSCRGVPSGFVTEGSDFILSTQNALSNDVPIPLRDDRGSAWWESVGGGGSDIRDWSYILLPHCSMDWHLGHREDPMRYDYFEYDGGSTSGWRVKQKYYHRGGINVDAVVEWIQKQFPSGLDALVTTAAGKIGGCNTTVTSSIAPAILASKLSSTVNNGDNASPSGPSQLVVIEGSDLWGPNMPDAGVLAENWNAIDIPLFEINPFSAAMTNLIESSKNTTQFIWMASAEENASKDETFWFMRQTNTNEEKFHVFQPQSISGETRTENDWCPLYTVPNSDADFSEFLADVIQSMSWSSVSSSTTTSATSFSSSLSTNDLPQEDEPRTRLSLLSVSIMISGVVILAWMIYYVVKAKNSRNGGNTTLSPTDLWFIALTQYPLLFFFVSLLIPIILSTTAFSQSALKINMDFDSYLQVNTELENVKRNYNEAQLNQQASHEIEGSNCRLYGTSHLDLFYRKLYDEESGDQSDNEVDFDIVDEALFGNRYLLDELDLDIQIDQSIPLDMLSPYHRELSLANLNYFSGGEWVSIMYQNRKGGNVFEPDVLKAIHDFENSIYDFPGFTDYCYGVGRNNCLPIDSLVSLFFNNGNLVSDIDVVSRSFLTNRPALWKLDQYFGPNNLQSNVTRSFVFLRNMGGDQSAVHPFLRSFYRNFLSYHFQKKTYPEMVHTWNNFILKQTEADDALLHDTLWSIGSLFFISLMILLKVQSFFLSPSSPCSVWSWLFLLHTIGCQHTF